MLKRIFLLLILSGIMINADAMKCRAKDNPEGEPEAKQQKTQETTLFVKTPDDVLKVITGLLDGQSFSVWICSCRRVRQICDEYPALILFKNIGFFEPARCGNYNLSKRFIDQCTELRKAVFKEAEDLKICEVMDKQDKLIGTVKLVKFLIGSQPIYSLINTDNTQDLFLWLGKVRDVIVLIAHYTKNMTSCVEAFGNENWIQYLQDDPLNDFIKTDSYLIWNDVRDLPHENYTVKSSDDHFTKVIFYHTRFIDSEKKPNDSEWSIDDLIKTIFLLSAADKKQSSIIEIFKENNYIPNLVKKKIKDMP